MEVKGKIIQVLELQSGTSKAGNPWRKQEYVLETLDAYPKKVHFDFFGDRIDQYPLNLGDTVILSFDIESREYQGRWFTSIRGWKAEKANDNNAGGAPAAPFDNTGMAAPAAPEFGPFEGESDDLPF